MACIQDSVHVAAEWQLSDILRQLLPETWLCSLGRSRNAVEPILHFEQRAFSLVKLKLALYLLVCLVPRKLVI